MRGEVKWRPMRSAMTRAICAGDSSDVAGSSHSPFGSAHSPFSSNLPITRGRTSSRQLYNSSFNWYSMNWRFSSTTRISSSPSAKWRTPSASSGQTMATL